MKKITYLGTIICLLIMAITATSQATDKPAVINVAVDMSLPTSPNEDRLSEAMSDLDSIIAATRYDIGNDETRSLNWTLFLVTDASLGNRLPLTSVGLDPSIEFAISGNESDEKLSSKSFNEQKAILEKAKEWAESCKVCGTNVITVKGFMPQSFDQNEDTYKVLDDMGIEYNAGFQAGILYAPGHENDVWPYKVENHKFYAVPVSTYNFSGEKVPLDDRYAKNKGLSGSQWYDLLAAKLDEISGKDEPMVISLSTSVSGNGDYLEAYNKFVKYALSKEAKFVKTVDLVDMARSGNHDVSAMTMPTESSLGAVESTSSNNQAKGSECTECDRTKNLTINNDTIIV
jgi:hypothetical protein